MGEVLAGGTWQDRPDDLRDGTVHPVRLHHPRDLVPGERQVQEFGEARVAALRGDDERLPFEEGKDVGAVEDEGVRRVDHLDVAVHDRPHTVGRLDRRVRGVGQRRPEPAQLGPPHRTLSIAQAIEQFLRAPGLVEQFHQ
ncbi:hypothetical protein ACFQY7_47150 [Actinomadura luteofluorescens]|uniref:hypothetical protein n=1 Tax=Actinomadura luteofluorescens TaxID=46163 RepID=UPI003633AEA5